MKRFETVCLHAKVIQNRSTYNFSFGVAAAVLGFIIHEKSEALILVAAAVIGGYMAMNIGANDVANNMGPAVGGVF